HDVALDFLRKLLAEADVAVDRVEVRVEAMHARAAEGGGERERDWSAHHGPPVRLSARTLLGCTARRGPAASTSGSRSPTTSPETRSPLRSTTSALLPASVKSIRSTSAAETSIVRPPTRTRSGANAPVTRRLSPLRMRARK